MVLLVIKYLSSKTIVFYKHLYFALDFLYLSNSIVNMNNFLYFVMNKFVYTFVLLKNLIPEKI